MKSALKRAREQSGLTQTEMADVCGVGRPNYTNFENGVWRPADDRSREIKQRAARVLIPKLVSKRRQIAASLTEMNGLISELKKEVKK